MLLIPARSAGFSVMSNEVAVEVMLYHTFHYSTIRTFEDDGTCETGLGVCGESTTWNSGASRTTAPRHLRLSGWLCPGLAGPVPPGCPPRSVLLP